MAFKPGWQAKEELPMFVILFVVIAIVMQYWVPAARLEQRLATALLVSVVTVSLEVILTGKHKA